jgi:hypothetical protein
MQDKRDLKMKQQVKKGKAKENEEKAKKRKNEG